MRQKSTLLGHRMVGDSQIANSREKGVGRKRKYTLPPQVCLAANISSQYQLPVACPRYFYPTEDHAYGSH